MHFVNQPGAEILLDCRDSAAEPNVLFSGRVSSPFERVMNSRGHEMEGGSPFHGQGCARVARQHEDGGMVGRIFPPPTLPVLVGPGTSDGSEHVSTHDPCPDVVKAACRNVIVNPSRSAILAMHCSKSTGREEPFVQRDAADPKWIVEVLVRAGAVAIDRYREIVDSKPGHLNSVLLAAI